MNNLFLLIVLCFCVTKIDFVSGYSIPAPVFTVFNPQGFRISIKGDPGLRFFAFNARVNKDLRANEPGDISGEVTAPSSDGQWTFNDPNRSLKIGDKLHFWIFVQHEQLGYRLEDQIYEIKGFNKPEQQDIVTHDVPLPPPPKCEISETKVNGEFVCKGQVVFEENFNNIAVDTSKWEAVTRFSTDVEDAEFCSYQNRTENFYTQDGKLVIVPTLQSSVPGWNETLIRSGKLDFGTKCTRDYSFTSGARDCYREAGRMYVIPPIVSAKLRTKKHFRFQYGTVEIRAKVPKGDWLYPEFFLDSYDYSYGPNYYESGQIRIAFVRGNQVLTKADGRDISGSKVFGTVIISNENNLREIYQNSKTNPTHFGNDFQNYGLKWTPNSLSFSVNGEIYAVFNNPLCGDSSICPIPQQTVDKWRTGSTLAPFDREFYLSIGVGVGGIGNFPDDSFTGTARTAKPWSNLDPRGELNFFLDRNNWRSTWNNDAARLQVESVKVTAL